MPGGGRCAAMVARTSAVTCAGSVGSSSNALVNANADATVTILVANRFFRERKPHAHGGVGYAQR